jgi:hypothetical protein
VSAMEEEPAYGGVGRTILPTVWESGRFGGPLLC